MSRSHYRSETAAGRSCVPRAPTESVATGAATVPQQQRRALQLTKPEASARSLPRLHGGSCSRALRNHANVHHHHPPQPTAANVADTAVAPHQANMGVCRASLTSDSEARSGAVRSGVPRTVRAGPAAFAGLGLRGASATAAGAAATVVATGTSASPARTPTPHHHTTHEGAPIMHDACTECVHLDAADASERLRPGLSAAGSTTRYLDDEELEACRSVKERRVARLRHPATRTSDMNIQCAASPLNVGLSTVMRHSLHQIAYGQVDCIRQT